MTISDHCLRCRRKLKNSDSLNHGFGPVCWKRVQKDIAQLEQEIDAEAVTA